MTCGKSDVGKEDQIDKKTLEISQDGDEVYKSIAEIGDELPDNTPRFVLLSYPLTLVGHLGVLPAASAD